PVRPDDAVVVHANRDRLRVAEAVRGRVAAGACIVVVQSLNRIEPEQASDVGESAIEAAAQPLLEGLLDAAGEPELRETTAECDVELGARGGFRSDDISAGRIHACGRREA